MAGLVLAGPVALRLFAADQDAKAQVAAEIQRAEQANKSANSAMPEVVKDAHGALKAAGESLQSNSVYLALERLLQAYDLFEGVGEVTAKAHTVEKNMAAFDAEWDKTSQELTSLSSQVKAKNWNGSPAAIRAMAETALGRSVPLLDGGRGFALATGPADGLFYVGQARGEAKFANFCASLQVAGNKPGWSARSMLPDLMALQAKTDAAFKPPASIEQHPRFIALNSTIKLARELDSTRFYYGALYQYLEAVRHYAMLDPAPVAANRQKELKAAIDAERAKLAGSGRDDSIPQIFLERAAWQVAHPDGSAPSADEWRSAQAIVTEVLPAYAAAMKTAPALLETKGKTVDVTLVRWPYT
ncbi:MAG TPA: hypothetical protein VKU01_03915 [Bryobacteraceae bacterium]|nr:hypothetical protein [Bryobacteraceae bacterium]